MCLLLQTAQYSTQIFSLAVLLSSLFVYNQMGGIDEAALDRCVAITWTHPRSRRRHCQAAPAPVADCSCVCVARPAVLQQIRCERGFLSLQQSVCVADG